METLDVSELKETDAGALALVEAPSLLEQYLSDPSHDYKNLKYGDVMDGVIMRIDRDEILVDIGSKSEGVVPAREFSSLTAEERDAFDIGESVLVFVVQPENQEGQAVVSIDRARQEKSWRKLQEIYEANDVIEAEVTNYNKGGLLVNLDGVRGFVPASQVSEIRGGDDASKQADMARLIGTSLPLKVIEINRHRNRLILSERQAVQERRDVMKEKLIEELKEGEVRRGRVSSICDFGAFVDIGGADGLVHLSELSWSRVRHPSEILKVGNEVDVYVLGINSQEKKIALSIKRTQAEPWSQVAAKYEVGQLVRGTVTQLANFGAFARIEDGIEGLIHVSELTDERIVHPKQVVKEGDDLLLRIIRIDPQRRRMGLSLRRALDTPEEELIQVFGDGILEERDRIVGAIHAALEAEGIEIGSGRSAQEESESEGGERRPEELPESSGPIRSRTFGIGSNDENRGSQAGSANQSESGESTQDRPTSSGSERNRREQRPAVELPVDLTNEPLSAMEMAFAMAGANLDLAAAEQAATEEARAATESEAASNLTSSSAIAEPEAPAVDSESSLAEAVTTVPESEAPAVDSGASLADAMKTIAVHKPATSAEAPQSLLEVVVEKPAPDVEEKDHSDHVALDVAMKDSVANVDAESEDAEGGSADGKGRAG